MEIPPSISKSVLLSNLKQGYIFWLGGGDEPFSSDKQHMFVVLNKSPLDDDILYLVNATSQVEKRMRFLSNMGIDIRSTTVQFTAGRYPYINRPTIIDCNTVHRVAKEVLLTKDVKTRFIDPQLTEPDMAAIKAAVLNSKQVPQAIKSKL